MIHAVLDSMTKERLEAMLVEADIELRQNILPYWMNRMVDQQHGGFYGRRDGFDRLVQEHDKGVILNTRILWTFSEAYKMFPDEQYQAVATRAFRYLCDFFIDRSNGGVFWMVNHAGQPKETKKQIYAQAFAIYALAAYHQATGDVDALKEAIALFHLIEQHSFDKQENGYLEAFSASWQLLDDLRLSEKDANEQKTMNTHLHVLEAYTVLYQVWPDPFLAAQLRNLIAIFREKIISDRFQYALFFDEHWKLQSQHTSFGHDIEGSWLLREAAKALGDLALLRMVDELAINTVDVTIRQGLDVDGGLMNEAGPEGLRDTDKHWWPQAEAMVGLLNAWEITANNHYLEVMLRVWSFVNNYLIDREHGEWYWLVTREGNVNFEEDKAGPWKCPYHNGRAMIEIIKRSASIRSS